MKQVKGLVFSLALILVVVTSFLLVTGHMGQAINISKYLFTSFLLLGLSYVFA